MRSDQPTQGSGLLFPLLIAITSHLLGFWLLWFGWQQASTVTEKQIPKFDPSQVISAVVVNQDPIEALRQKQQAEAAAKARAAERKREREAQRKAEARKQALIRQREEARKREQEQQRREAAKREAERKAAEEARRQAEIKRQQELKNKQLKAAQEKAKQEKARREKEEEARRKRDAKLAAAKAQKEALAAAEAERKRQEALEAEKRSLQSALAQEDAFLAELEDQAQLASMQSLIKAYVEQNWSRPPTARKGMQVILRIELLPTGEVNSVEVVESSADSAFDRSAEQAVYRAGPFRELKDLKPHQREAFRSFNLVFKPEDIQ